LTKKERMLVDEDVKRWFDNLGRGSTVTANVYIRRLSLFCETNGLSPTELVDLAKGDRKKAEDLVLDHVTRMEHEGNSPGYISGIVKSVRSWLKYNDAELKRRIKIRSPNATPSIEDERVPTQQELKTILIYAGDRTKVSIAFMAFAGLRPQSIGNSSGTDGLRLKDLPEMNIEGEHVRFEKVPTRVVVRASLSKARHKYFTFLPQEGCDYLSAYLERRIAEGEDLTANSPVVSVTAGYDTQGKSKRNRGSSFITTRNITREIRRAIKPRYSWRPYVMRAYFDSQMLLAENQGKLTPAYRTFFMGHTGDIEARYTTHKGRLSEQMIEDMRSSFSKSEEFLTTIPRSGVVDEERIKIDAVLAIAKMQGFSTEKLDSVRKVLQESENPTLEEVMELLSADLPSSLTVRHLGSSPLSSSVTVKDTGTETKDVGKPFEAQIVDESELTDYLERGFDLIATTNDGKYILRKRNHIP